MKNSTLSKKTILLSVLLMLAIWHFTAAYLNAPLILPLPSRVLQKAVTLLGQKSFLFAMLNTAKRCLTAFSISVLTGLILGSFCAFFPICEAFFEVPLAIIRSVPVISIILLALFWLKSNTIPVFAAVLMSLPIMKNCTQAGFKSCSKPLLQMANVYKLTKIQKFLFIRIPYSSTSIITGIKNCSGMTWKVVAAGEVLSLPLSALGTYLQNAQTILETEQVFATTAVIIAMSSLCSVIINRLAELAVKTGFLFNRWYFSKKLFFCNKNCMTDTQLHDGMLPQEIHIKNLNLGYESLIYRDFSLNIAKSEILALLAPSGCGKTTLLNYIAANNKNENTAYIFQEPRLIPSLTVLQNIMIPLSNLMSQSMALEHAMQYLEKTGLKQKQNALPTELSGGEKQRASLARAFAYPSGLLLMDEPFQSQDFETKAKLMQLFETLQKEQNRTAILVTHTPSEAEKLAHRTIKLQGRPVTVVTR